MLSCNGIAEECPFLRGFREPVKKKPSREQFKPEPRKPGKNVLLIPYIYIYIHMHMDIMYIYIYIYVRVA